MTIVLSRPNISSFLKATNTKINNYLKKAFKMLFAAFHRYPFIKTHSLLYAAKEPYYFKTELTSFNLYLKDKIMLKSMENIVGENA